MKCSSNSYSRLLQDLMSLERDYAYNENLLKMKDDEIARLNEANARLQETLGTKITEVQNLQCKMFNMEAQVMQIKKEMENQNCLNQEMVDRLKQELNEVRIKNEQLINQQKIALKKKEMELTTKLNATLREKQFEHANNLIAVEEKIQQEKNTVCILTEQLKKEVDVSMRLRTRLRELENKYSSEKSFFEEEVRSLQTLKSNLLAEMNSLKSNSCALQSNLSNSLFEIKKYQEDLKLLHSEIKSLTNKVSAITSENESLKRKLIDVTNINRSLTSEIQELKKKKLELQPQSQISGREGSCFDERHKIFNDLQKQNVVLQEIIKRMRKDKEENELKNRQSIEEAEYRIKRLEALVNTLKEFIHCNGSYEDLENYCCCTESKQE